MKKLRPLLFISLFCLLGLFCSSAYAEQKIYSIPINHSPQFGPPNAPITIIEFIDFQ